MRIRFPRWAGLAPFVVIVIGISLAIDVTRGSAPSAPTTQPALNDPILSAWESIQHVVGSVPTTQPADDPGHLQAVDLNAMLASRMVPGTDVTPFLGFGRFSVPLGAGGVYPCNNTPVLRRMGTALVGRNSTLLLHPRRGASSGIVVQAAGCELAGLRIVGPGTAAAPWGVGLRVYSSKLRVRDCLFPPGLDGGILLDAGANGATIEHCTFGVLGGESIYITSDDVQVVGCTFTGSLGEHDARVDANASTGRRPARISFTDCSFVNRGHLKKECLTGREVDTLTVTRCTFDGWVSAGQSSEDKNWHARHLTFDHCTWLTPRAGGALVELKHDCDAVFTGCTFPGSARDPAITIDERGTVTATDCTLICPPGVKPKGLVRTSDPSATIKETGTVIRIADTP